MIKQFIFIKLSIILSLSTIAQDTTACKVISLNLNGRYAGDCKKGVADGVGEANGIDKYKGNFKFGLPNGKGIYYYGDTLIHEGKFQDGLREGKGESRYIRQNLSDSIVKGFWSGDIYRGKSYITYEMSSIPFEIVDVFPSENTGNSITFTIVTMRAEKIEIVDIYSNYGQIIKAVPKYSSTSDVQKYYLSSFPEDLRIILSNNTSFSLKLYKAANWNVFIKTNRAY